MRLYPSAVVGYRAFFVQESHLASSSKEFEWEKGENKAVCLLSETTHTAAHSDCDCGFYALHSAQSVRVGRGFVKAAVVGAGRVEIHSHGWRAQRARVVALLSPRNPVRFWRLREVARAYGVPLVFRESALERIALSEGCRAPSSLIPESEEDFFWQFGERFSLADVGCWALLFLTALFSFITPLLGGAGVIHWINSGQTQILAFSVGSLGITLALVNVMLIITMAAKMRL